MNVRQPIIKNLQEYINSLPDKTHPNWSEWRRSNAKDHLTDAINMLNGGDMTDQIPQFIEFSDVLDEKQKVKKTWRELLPELAKEVL